MSKPAPSPAERMDDAEFERHLTDSHVNDGIKEFCPIVAEARRARESEAGWKRSGETANSELFQVRATRDEARAALKKAEEELDQAVIETAQKFEDLAKAILCVKARPKVTYG